MTEDTTQNADAEDTFVDTTANAVSRNVGALTPKRILGLFVALGTIYVGVQLGQIDVPFEKGLYGFALFAVTAMHMHQRERGGTIDLVVAAWTALGFILVGTSFGFLSFAFTDNWAGLVTVSLIVLDGYIIEGTA